MIAACYDLLYLLSLSIAAVSFAAPLLFPIELSSVMLTALTLVVSLFFLGVKHFGLKGRAILLGCAAAVLPTVMILTPSEGRIDLFREHIWLIQTILIVLLCFMVGELCRHYRVLRIILSVVGIVLLLGYLFTGRVAPKTGCCAILFYLLCTLADESQHHSVKEGETEPKKHLTFIAPFLIIIFLPTILLKTPAQPYRWDFVRRIAGAVENGYEWVYDTFIREKRGYEDVSFIGFSGRGEFGGNISGSDREVMHLSSRTESDPWVYLAGRSFDRFDGRNWEKTESDATYDMSYDTIETMSTVLDYRGDLFITDLMKRTAITIEYTDLKTECIFLPMKYVPGLRCGDYETYVEGGDLVFAEKDRNRTSYEVVYYRINTDTDAFRSMLSEKHEIDRQSWQQALDECGIITDNLYTYEDYLGYRDWIYDTYLPDTQLSDKAKAYLDEYLDGAESDYEKLLRIKELLKGFTYTEQPGELPEEIGSAADYLDYFLFDKQEGYCSYYATAFVLMARYCGIPAAYVQGFHVPMGKYPESNIRSSFAHAWAMAYIDGIGWFPFEPTPGMTNEVAWKTEAEREAERGADPEAKFSEDETTPDRPDPDAIVHKIKFRLRWYHILIPVLTGLFVVFMIYVIDGIVRRDRYRKLPDREKCIRLCIGDLKLLQRMGAGKMEQETISEYRDRLRGHKDLPLGEEHLAFCTTYEELIYAERPTDPEIVKTLEEEQDRLKEVVRKYRRDKIFDNLKKGIRRKK